jgi:adenylosuccinate synthase
MDGLALRHAARVNGLDALAVTKLDVLSGLETIRVAVSYRVGSEVLTEFPARLDLLEHAEPIYEEHPGWTGDIGGARRLEDLPEPARNYLHRLQEIADVPVSLVSVGQGREQTIQATGQAPSPRSG